MNREEFKDKIKSMLKESIEEGMQRKYIRSIVSESVYKMRGKKLMESGLNESEGDDNITIKRNTVMKMLKNEKYNHAFLAYQLWHPKDDDEKATYRSLFSKMSTGKPDADGVVRHFSDDEITKLYQMMRKN